MHLNLKVYFGRKKLGEIINISEIDLLLINPLEQITLKFLSLKEIYILFQTLEIPKILNKIILHL